ncbi:MAG: hypothetical protein H7318_17085 [Oligoflexus sp.]|nr:hypothetical protein [Oligoflexus sp.]
MMRTLLLLIISLLLSQGLALAAAPVFKVGKKQGKISIKGPMELAWHPLNTRTLSLGTLIRVDALSSIELSLQDSAIHDDDVQHRIQINRPLITRLDEDLMRRTELKDYPLKDLWDTGEESAKMNKGYPMLSFASAFIRSIITLDRVPKLPETSYKDEKQEVEIGANVKKIKILSPSAGGFYFLSNGIASIPVIWDEPENNLKYRVYIWDTHDPRTRPIAVVPDSWYQLEWTKVGNFKIQIEDESHRYRSEAIMVTVDRPMADIVADEKNAPDSPMVDITLLSPYARATQFAKSASHRQMFSWEDKVSLEKNQFYRLTLTKKGEKVRKIKTTAQVLELDLTPGVYTWVVQKMASAREKNPKSSNPRTLEIRVGAPSLSKILHDAPSQTVYMELN